MTGDTLPGRALRFDSIPGTRIYAAAWLVAFTLILGLIGATWLANRGA